MISFEEAKRLVISDFQQRAREALAPRPRLKVCDTGKGGADHCYQVEENRREAAQADNDASRQSAKWQGWVERIEQLHSFEEYIGWLRSVLQRDGWERFEEGYEVDFRALRAPLYYSNSYRYDFLTVLMSIHDDMLRAAPVPQELLRQAYRRMRVAAKPVRRLVDNPNQVPSAVLPAVRSYLPSVSDFLAALRALAKESADALQRKTLNQWVQDIIGQQEETKAAVAAATSAATSPASKTQSVAVYQAYASLFNSCVDAYDQARQQVTAQSD
ncbi:MAG: hypothetical protein CTY21_13675 [Methylomonas sp.]|nr:MAG: hypothetical protein CTY21_13675 [Methylomonas sp.]